MGLDLLAKPEEPSAPSPARPQLGPRKRPAALALELRLFPNPSVTPELRFWASNDSKVNSSLPPGSLLYLFIYFYNYRAAVLFFFF